MFDWTCGPTMGSFAIGALEPPNSGPGPQAGIFMPGFRPVIPPMAGGRVIRRKPNSRACLFQVLTSRHQRVLEASTWCFVNARIEAAMTRNARANPPKSHKPDLYLYLAFLQREADFLRASLGLDGLDGDFTPVRAEVNRLYFKDVHAGLCARSSRILEVIGGCHE